MNLRRLAGTAAGFLLLTGAAVACSEDESVFNAEAGECIEDVTDLSGNIAELPETDCTEDHNGEIIGLFEHDDGDFPGLDELSEEAAEACQGDIFEDYTGTEYLDSAITVQAITPTEQSWDDADDRESICVAFTPEDIDVSFQDNGEDFLIGGDDDSGDDTSTTETTAAADDEEDTSLDDYADLVESCEGGNLADCDSLYQSTPVGSEAEEVGATCGGREDDLPADFTPGFCEDALG